jgi:hypothetical protein
LVISHWGKLTVQFFSVSSLILFCKREIAFIGKHDILVGPLLLKCEEFNSFAYKSAFSPTISLNCGHNASRQVFLISKPSCSIFVSGKVRCNVAYHFLHLNSTAHFKLVSQKKICFGSKFLWNTPQEGITWYEQENVALNVWNKKYLQVCGRKTSRKRLFILLYFMYLLA